MPTTESREISMRIWSSLSWRSPGTSARQL
jgi:hypothetical protein